MTDFLAAVVPLVSLSDGPLLGLPLRHVWYVVLFFLLGMFLLLDGFDFGIGALFLLRDDEERETMLAAVGPFWDGNEVWLIVFGGAMFAAFPPVYANLFSRHYLLMFAILGALILRGIAPEMYEQRHDETWQRYWGLAFSIGSILAPFFLGVFAGNWLLGSAGSMTLGGVVVGLALVALTVVDGAAFLAMKTRGQLQADATDYGTYALVAYLTLVVVALGYILATQPSLADALLTVPGLGLVVATVALAAGYVWAMRAERRHVAFVTVAGLVFGLVTLVAWLMYPLVDPATGLTFDAAIVSALPLNLMTIVVGILLPVVLVYFGVLYSVFSGPIEAGEGY
ncbi:MAG: cytochrome d ubiquinol oxidase subunit II [Halorhabdus sp.]